MANDFTTDPNCAALYRFENGALNIDSIGNNDTVAQNSPAADLGDFKEGAASCDFESADNDSFRITNANLDDGFPGKSNDTKKVWSAGCWFKLESMPTGGSPDFNFRVFCGIGTSPKSSWQIRMTNGGGTPYVNMSIGHSGGASNEHVSLTGRALSTATWYHYMAAFRDSDRAYRMRLYDDGNLTAYTQSGTFVNNMNIEDGGFEIGESETSHLAEMDGLIDEMPIFNDFLTFAEMAAIQEGTYTGPTVGGIAILWSDF